MSHLWLKDSVDGWTVVPIDGEERGIVLTRDAGRPLRLRNAEGAVAEPAVLLRHGGPTNETWLLMVDSKMSDVEVNGRPMNMGIRVLGDRDEIRLNGVRLFFSTERQACVEPFPGADQPVFCPRCKQLIEEGTTSVRCPRPECGIWHHQTDGLPCWSRFEHCALCSQSTDLDAGFTWTPEGL